MSAPDPASILDRFLQKRTRQAIVRLLDPSITSADGSAGGIFTGFFISPFGHLLTAFHPLKHQLFDPHDAFEFEIMMEFDVTTQSGVDPAAPICVLATYLPGASDFRSDWALLKINFEPSTYLPVASPAYLRSNPGDCLPFRAYGFTEDQADLACLGAYEGQFVRLFPERSQFRTSFINRGPGQSGGPVIDLTTRTVVGVVSGLYQRRELLTADAALIDEAVLSRHASDLDLRSLSDGWRREAADFLCTERREFRQLDPSKLGVRLDEKHLYGREVTHRVMADITGGAAQVLLHGARGSGKTSLALEVATALRNEGLVDSVFWYDFDQVDLRGGDQLIPSLAVHLLMTDRTYQAVEAYSLQSSDRRAIETSLCDAVERGRHVLVFENVHFPLREDRTDIITLIARLAEAASSGRSKVLLTSWDPPRDPLRPTPYPVEGFSDPEVQEFLRLHGLEPSEQLLSYIGQYSSDIECVRLFATSPEWQRKVRDGQALPLESRSLLLYWVSRFLDNNLPAGGRQLLLALAILERASDYETLRSVSGIEEFLRVFDLLQKSPPLIIADETASRYTAHLNVRRAVLHAAADDEIKAAHTRAADYWTSQHEYTSAARHYLSAGNADDALSLIYDKRDTILASGHLHDLEGLANEIADRHAYNKSEAQFHVQIIRASCSNIQGEYKRAIEQWNVALRHAADDVSRAVLHNRMGNSYRLVSDYQNAMAAYGRAASIAEAAARDTTADEAMLCSIEAGRARLGLAKLARLQGSYGAARQQYLAARADFEYHAVADGLIETSFGLGEIDRLLGSLRQAGEHYAESYDRARQQGSTEREAYALWGIGEVQRLRGLYDDAEVTHQRGLDLCVEVSDTRSEGWALLGLAETRRAVGQLDSAMTDYENAKRRFNLTGSTTEVAHAVLGLAETYRARGPGECRLELYDEAERTYRQKELRHCLVLCCLAKTCALRCLADRREDADRYLGEVRQLAEEIGLKDELTTAEAMRKNIVAQPSIALNFP